MLTLTSGRFVECYYITHFESDPTLVSVREIRVSRLGLCIWYSDWRFPRVSSAPSHICRASTKFKPRPLPNALQSIIRQSYKYISTLCTLQYWQRLQNAHTHTHTHTQTHTYTHTKRQKIQALDYETGKEINCESDWQTRRAHETCFVLCKYVKNALNDCRYNFHSLRDLTALNPLPEGVC